MSQPVASGLSRRLIVPALVLLGLAIAALLIYLVRDLMAHGTELPKKPPKIALITPPPPPPPPPPKFEKKPDPPKEQKEVKVEQPVPQQQTPPPAPSNDLKMDGPAGNGPSAFGSGNITSEDLSRVGSGKGGTGTGAPAGAAGMFNPFTNYANLAKGEVQRSLGRRENLRRSRYSLEVHLWVQPNGAIQRFELVGGSGEPDVDELIKQAIAGLGALSQPVPANMAMPIRLRVRTGGA